MTRRTLEQLIDTAEPGIELVRQWLQSATNPVELLDVDAEHGRRTLPIEELRGLHVVDWPEQFGR